MSDVINNSLLPASSKWRRDKWDVVPLETCDVQMAAIFSMVSTIWSMSCTNHVTYDVIYRKRNYWMHVIDGFSIFK